MAKKHFQFRVDSKHSPAIEISGAGLYVRFQSGVKAAKTLVRCEWPHVALDLAADDSVIGIECVPPPDQLSLGAIAEKAGVALPRQMSARDVRISAPAKAATGLVAV
jgi:hypothetical protein